jgi:hypothetical protein
LEHSRVEIMKEDRKNRHILRKQRMKDEKREFSMNLNQKKH